MMAIFRRYGVAMATEQFDVTFDGPALDEHRIDVRELAPALLGLADAFQAAQSELAPDARRANLEIKAQREGSFAIDLVLNTNLVEHALNFLTGRHATAVANGGGILALVLVAWEKLLWLRNRSYTTEDLADGHVRLTTADGDSIVLSAATLQLLQSHDFRAQSDKFVAPLQRDGIDSISVDSPVADAPRVVVTKANARSLAPAESPETVVTDNTVEQVVTVESVPFREDLVWRFWDGQSSITATMQDLGFRDRIRRRAVQFGEGDKLRADVRTVQTEDAAGKLSTTRSVVRVIDHIPGPTQGSLFD